MFALKIVSILLLYDVDHQLKCSEKPSENLLDTRVCAFRQLDTYKNSSNGRTNDCAMKQRAP